MSEPRKTLVELFADLKQRRVEYERADTDYRRREGRGNTATDATMAAGLLEDATGEFIARLREADFAEESFAQERHAVAVLRADRDREIVNREAAQRVLTETVRERDALAERYVRLRKVAEQVLDDVDLGRGVSLTTIAHLGALLRETGP